jgi:ABC-type branched-subunit amino acid transport system substrate-binding protein
MVLLPRIVPANGGACEPIAPENDFGLVTDAALRHITPEVVVLATRTRESACITRRLRERHVRVPIIAADGTGPDAELHQLGGPAVDSIYVVALRPPIETDSSATTFRALVRRVLHREATPADALAFDGVMVLAAAAQANPSREGVHEYLRSLGRSRPPFRGVSGPLSFAPDRPVSLRMTRVQGTHLSLIEPPQ